MRDHADHPDPRWGSDGPRGAFIVDRDVPARHGRIECAAGIRDAASRFPKLEKDLGTLGAAEVQAVRDAGRLRPGAGDIACRFGHGSLAALVRIEPHVPAVAIGFDRDPELFMPDSNHTGIAAWRYHSAGLNRRIVLLEDPLFARNGRGIE